MANTVFKLRRSSVAGKVPNTSSLAIGELALNLTDKKLYSSDGSAVWETGANLSSLSVANSSDVFLSVNSSIAVVNTDININNNFKLSFDALSGSSNVYFIQQNDDNFVFYISNTSGGSKPVWSIYSNSATSNINFSVPATFSGNVTLGTSALSANGSTGSAGHVLTSNGTATYWISPTVAATNTNAQYFWSNTHTFQANVSFTGNNISVVSNTGSILFNGNNDANWRIGRNTGSITKWVYTNNTIDIITANSTNEGFAIGLVSNATYFETGYLGTYVANKITVGSSTSNATINSTAITANSITIASSNTATFTNINGQTNASSGDFKSNAYASLGGYGGNYLAFGQQTNFHQWIQSGYSAASPTYYSIILNPLGGNIGIGNTNPSDKLSVNGTTYLGGNVTLGSSGLSANGSYGSAGQSLLSNGTATYWATAGATLNANNSDTQTYYIGLSNASSGAWTNAVVSTTKLYYVPSTGKLDASIVNASSFTVGTSFTANSTVVNAVSYYAGTTLIGNTTGPYGKTEVNLNVNNALTSNTASYLGNSSGTIANLTTWIAGNSATAYTNAVSYTDGKISTANSAITANAATAYTNAVSYTDSKIATANSAITGNAATAYTNAVSYVNGLKLDSVTNTSITYIPVANTVKNAYDRAIDANTRAASAQTAASSAYTNAVSYTDSKIATANSAITGNAATAYTNAVSYTDSKIATANSAITGNAATAYTNATTFASNASNITTGTLPYAQLGAAVVNTSGSFSLSGNTTLGGTNTVINSNTTIAGFLTATGGSKISVMENQDGGSSRGIYLWNDNDTNWGIYMSQAGVNKSLANGTAAAGINGSSTYAVRFRAANATPTDQAGFIWENNVETALMQLEPTNGDLFVKRTINAASFSVGTSTISNSTGVYTGIVNAASHTVGTSTVANSTGVYTGIVNAASHTVGTSTVANSTGVYTGIVNGSSHTVGTAFTANATVVNAVTYYVGTTLIGNSTGPYGKTEATLNVNSSVYATNSVNANNADYLDGQHGSYYAANSLLANYALLAGATFSGDVTVNANLVVTGTTVTLNTATLDVKDKNITVAKGSTAAASDGAGLTVDGSNIGWYYTYSSNTWTSNVGITPSANVSFDIGSSALNWRTVYANSVTAVNVSGNGASVTSVNAIALGGKTEGNLNVNNALTANNSDYLDGNHGTYYTNATNITTGTLPYSQIPANIINTTAAFTISGVHTHSANIVLGSSGLSANGSFGTAAHVLHSNGTATYWAADDQGVTSVATGNGLTGGTITTTGTVSVLANTGIVANATGLYVNATYIGTLSANNTTYVNGKTEGNLNVNSAVTVTTNTSTNTFTIGTASYFVSNGNFGIGTSVPAYKLHVAGDGCFTGDVYAAGGQVYTSTADTRQKLHLWGTDTTYVIGMQSAITFGGLGDYAMTFQFNNETDRGFWWGHNGHTTAQGAMALTTDGRLTVAKSMRLGFGESDSVDPGTNYTLEVSGAFAATTKSFVIDHPSKPGKKLRYGSLEGPENGVYIRGRLTGEKHIQFPDYWSSLVDIDSITVSLTPIGKTKMPSIGEITKTGVDVIGTKIDCFYHVYAERKDVDKLVVEFDA